MKIKAWMMRYLDPEDILLEVIFGLLIVMTFTMAFRAVDAQLASQDVVVNQVQRMLVAAIGCTIAWGMIDAVITILTNVSSRAKGMHIVARIQESPNDGAAVAVVAEALDGIVEKVTSSDERTEFYSHIAANARTLTPEPQGITREDVYSAIVVIMSAMLATLPALIPYLFVTDANWAIRLSNLIAVAMLFGVGFLWARMTGGKPVKVGLLLATVGVVIILIAIPLGG